MSLRKAGGTLQFGVCGLFAQSVVWCGQNTWTQSWAWLSVRLPSQLQSQGGGTSLCDPPPRDSTVCPLRQLIE